MSIFFSVIGNHAQIYLYTRINRARWAIQQVGVTTELCPKDRQLYEANIYEKDIFNVEKLLKTLENSKYDQISNQYTFRLYSNSKQRVFVDQILTLATFMKKVQQHLTLAAILILLSLWTIIPSR